MSGAALTLRQISKSFGSLCALDQVNLEVAQGTIHAVLGENGAGKTTLMNILFGLYQPDEGEIRINGTACPIYSPKHAMNLGIGMIHQHFMLVESLTVAENVTLGLRQRKLTLDLKAIADQLSSLSQEYGFDIDPHAEVWKLPIGMRQRVEILKVLFRAASVIILDEPTSVLAPSEIKTFLNGLERLRNAGKTVIFITHKLEEVEAVADHVTIMQHGRVKASKKVADTCAKDLARLMVGREIEQARLKRGNTVPGAAILRLVDVSARDQRGILALRDVSLSVRAGEVLGVAGVDGNGQAELAKVITGLLVPEKGEVLIDEKNVTAKSVRARRHQYGLSYVPDDRQHIGLVLDFTVAENAMLRDFNVAPFSKKGIIDARYVRSRAAEWVDRYDVRTQSVDQKVRYLSGGNQQKLIFAREVECASRVLVVMQPTKGLDVGATEAVQKTVMRERDAGKAILYISTELEHIIAVADRIAVMCSGEITGILTPDEVTDQKIGALMGGLQAAELA